MRVDQWSCYIFLFDFKRNIISNLETVLPFDINVIHYSVNERNSWDGNKAWNKEGTRNVSNFVLPTVKSFFIGRNLERRLVHSRDFDEIIISSSIFTNMMNILFDLRRLWILLTQIPREIDDTVSRFADERRRTNFLGFFFF